MLRSQHHTKCYGWRTNGLSSHINKNTERKLNISKSRKLTLTIESNSMGRAVGIILAAVQIFSIFVRHVTLSSVFRKATAGSIPSAICKTRDPVVNGPIMVYHLVWSKEARKWLTNGAT